jgi:hypothetical protein
MKPTNKRAFCRVRQAWRDARKRKRNQLGCGGLV